MPELQVSKKDISTLFNSMKKRKFIIPDFQRPYRWDIEKCETLWNDIVVFFRDMKKDSESDKGSESDADYFLGTIVTYINKDKNQEIIDGQQRLTSLFLLLRAFFKKLEDMDEDDDDITGLKNKVAPCIWEVDPISGKVINKSLIHIESLVATAEDNDIFHSILNTGNCSANAKDNYSLNYNFFKKECDDYAEKNPLHWKQLLHTILERCIILPIECDKQETALTIFSTLNDRGLPLADSDIFKAQIYRGKTSDEQKKEFTTTWKELTQICKQGKLSIDDVFRYYSHVLRGRDNDKSKEIGLRKFYAINNFKKLQENDLITEIIALADFWRWVNNNIEPDEKVYYKISNEARKYLHCLRYYPNDYWKYPASVFFVKNKESKTFSADFAAILKNLVAFLFVKFIHKPTVNAIKDDIYLACISLTDKQTHKYPMNKEDLNKGSLREKIANDCPPRISTALLLLHAYLNNQQEEPILSTFHIEHIFPKKWQNTNYNGWNEVDAASSLESFGNKVVFEQKLNIQAGNGYFGRKKEKYNESKISDVTDLSKHPNEDWLKDDIEKRKNNFNERIMTFFKNQLEKEHV